MKNTRRFKVRGMDCAEEIRGLKETVGALPGVQFLDFNLIDGIMSVEFDPQKTDEDKIRAAARLADLEAEPVDEKTPSGVAEPEAGWWRKNGQSLLCWCSGILVGLGFLTHAVMHRDLLHALIGGEDATLHEFPLPVILCYASAVVAGGWFVFPKALLALRRFRADMNLLMSIAVIGAMAIGQWLEAATVAFLFSFSLLLESWSISRARRAIQALLNIAPSMARYICPNDGDIMEKPVAAVPLGATVLVRPGERIPLDGIITKGRTLVNQAPITGESMPVSKKEGSEVFAGTINEDGSIEFKATKAVTDTTLARIIRLVEQAQSRRAPVEQWIETFAFYYTPAMIFIAAMVAILPPLFTGQWSRWFYEALVMLVIACPCALVISTPVSIVAALTAAARAGVLIKGGVFLEAVGRVNSFALDKTGTLTKGLPEVQEIVPLNGHTRSEILARAAALEIHSEHPLAAAILRKTRMEMVEPLIARDFRALKGRGAEAFIDDSLFWVGSHRLLHEKGGEDDMMHIHAQRMEDAGHSVVVVGSDCHICGIISVADSLRPEAPALVYNLKAAGITHVIMLTGDNQGTAEAVGKTVMLDEIRAELLPEDKLKAIEALKQKFGGVAMVGDGINDAPALASATVGISMGFAGTDAAIETSDITLMSDDLSRLPWLVRHSRRALRVIRQNIFFSLGIKGLFMALALMQMATLWMAIAADIGASLLVIFNALRLLSTKELDEKGGTAPNGNLRMLRPGLDRQGHFNQSLSR